MASQEPADGGIERDVQQALLATVEAMTYPMGVIDPSRRILYVNRAGRRLLGIGEQEDLSELRLTDFQTESALNLIRNAGLPTAVREGAWCGEIVLRRRDGIEVPVSQLLMAHRGPESQVRYLSTIMFDLTERRRAEERERNLYSTILDTVRALVVVLDREGRIVRFNRACVQATGYSIDEVVGERIWDRLIPPESSGEVRAVFESLTTGQFPNRHDNYWLTKTGERRLIAWSNTAVLGPDGSVDQVVGTGLDITEQRRAEETIARQAREIIEVGTPVVQVWPGLVLVPLIGILDSQRTEQLMERLLNRIVETRSEIALLDITGVPAIDTQTARYLIETITAVKLLGAEVVLTGVRPAIAQTLVHLGIDLSGVTTRSSLEGGIRYALGLLHLHVTGGRRAQEGGQS